MIEKLKRVQVEEKLKDLGFMVFSPPEFRGVFRASQKTASMFIMNNVKSGLFIKLRNNFYMLKDSNPDYCLVANRLYQPSYVSLETALSHYHVIPEVVYGTTSVTTKATRDFKTPIGNFSYQRIKVDAFTGYNLKEIDRHKVFFAEAEKALADYLYFVDLKRVSLNDRLDLRKVNRSKLIKYARLFKRSNMMELINLIYARSRKPAAIY
ncbi:MAG: hypothetical protein HY978_00600 [Candidatus Liptonbacteria bacterium]|nr:hypothetical protein [Candidatus Liptonbacteria bacterium]